MTTAEISERLVSYGNIKRPMALSRLGMLLGQRGYKKTRVGKQRICGWIVYSFKSDEIESRKRLHAREVDA